MALQGFCTLRSSISEVSLFFWGGGGGGEGGGLSLY